MASDCRLVKRFDPKAEMIEVSPFRPRRGSSGTPEFSGNRHEVEERATGTKLYQANRFLATLDSATERVAVETKHPVEINDTQDEVI
jgi:hypothetical protein